MSNLKHAVILCGGYGTRFLPMTKVLPKELFPLVDRPALDYLIKEAVDSGITNITIVINKRKTLIKDYFEQDLDYENFVTDMLADRDFIGENAALCGEGEVMRCMLVQRRGQDGGVLVVPERGSFVGWAALAR